ncbi:MAG: demethoxyubiquinone hydroxylase family protein [Marinicella pacifica]
MKEVERILRVDHAGDCGAIQIYKTIIRDSHLMNLFINNNRLTM